MIIKRLLLNNIRSYVSQEINFPKGKVLLSGNIGSGKSTVLLAIDFALFGLRRGELSGASLLRNGTDRGFVELTFTLDDKEVIIRRSLKRSNNSVVQDSGYIIFEGKKEECTAVELKQKVLELLNYPLELITKNKHMVYQYTVYTPQEQMKQILTGDKEYRLDTLRRVFGIDKYKRIVENARIVISKLKEKRREFEGIIFDLASKEAEHKRISDELQVLKKQLEEIMPLVQSAKEEVNLAKLKISEMEAKIERLRKIKSEAELMSVTVTHKTSARDEKLEKLKKLKEEIGKLANEGEEIKDFSKEIVEKKNRLNEMNDILREKSNKLHELITLKSVAEGIKEKISSLDKCPTCYQDVSREHKDRVFKDSDKKIADISVQIEAVNNSIKLVKDDITKLEGEIEEMTKEQHKAELAKARMKELDSRKAEKDVLVKEISKLGEEIESAILSQKELMEKAAALPGVESQYAPLKSELEKKREYLMSLEKRQVEIETKINSFERMLDALMNDIKAKQQAKAKLNSIVQFQQWMQEYFINLMGIMERNVMLKVHSDFGTLFEKWFGLLIDSDVLAMRLDEEFSPLIEQNGYNIDYENLSGGEKTAAALAYRLALNQVINNMMSSIKTRGLIILDEPTDGFSSEQLEKMRLLLDELDLSQVIIVSHEPKIESFVDNVIKFEKKEHVSRVMC